MYLVVYYNHRGEIERSKEMTKEMQKVVNMMIGAYIEVMGTEKWNELNGEEQRAVIMTLVKDTHKALDIIEK